MNKGGTDASRFLELSVFSDRFLSPTKKTTRSIFIHLLGERRFVSFKWGFQGSKMFVKCNFLYRNVTAMLTPRERIFAGRMTFVTD
ncbi:MAG: hypothetical protein IPN69_12510 [Acidobacteria bacterium]|nr:hypothetical protein [Acidobacteriota bacterium]